MVNSLAWAGPLASFMALGKSLYLPGPHFTQLQNEDLTWTTLILGVLSHWIELMISSLFKWAGHGTGSVVPSVTRPGEEEVHSQDTTGTGNGFMCETWSFLKYLRPVGTSWGQQIVGWN